MKRLSKNDLKYEISSITYNIMVCVCTKWTHVSIDLIFGYLKIFAILKFIEWLDPSKYLDD